MENFPSTNGATVKIYTLTDCCEVLSELRHLVCVSYIHQALHFVEKTIT